MWSIPGHLKLIHSGTSMLRQDKIFAISGEPLVQNHLRVCWENRSKTGNCSTCEKCLRTMASLNAINQLPDFSRVFDVETPLHKLLDDLTYVPEKLLIAWDAPEKESDSELTKRAIQRLQHRSKRINRNKRLMQNYRFIKGRIKAGVIKATHLFNGTSDKT